MLSGKLYRIKNLQFNYYNDFSIFVIKLRSECYYYYYFFVIGMLAISQYQSYNTFDADRMKICVTISMKKSKKKSSIHFYQKHVIILLHAFESYNFIIMYFFFFLQTFSEQIARLVFFILYNFVSGLAHFLKINCDYSLCFLKARISDACLNLTTNSFITACKLNFCHPANILQ